MKKTIFIFLLCLLVALTTLYPAGVIITARFGYRIELISISAFSVAITLLSGCIVIFSLLFRPQPESKTVQFLLTIITPTTFINAVFYIFASSQPFVVALSFLSVGFCSLLVIIRGKTLAIKIVALATTALMIFPVGCFSLFALVFGNFGENTVTKTVESPGGTYYAEVIDSDQGALGGDTYVNVHKNSCVDLILFKIKKKPQRAPVTKYFLRELFWLIPLLVQRRLVRTVPLAQM